MAYKALPADGIALAAEKPIQSSLATLYRIAGVSAALIAVLIPAQAIVFIVSPPPSTVPDYFALFQTNRFLGYWTWIY